MEANSKKPETKPEVPEAESEKKNHNLLLLGVVSVAVALLTTSVSIIIYHNSGDIYLDRSRPGFLPDEEEIDEPTPEEFEFSESGPVTEYDLNEYLKHFQENLDALDSLGTPYSPDPLSNSALGIPEKK